MSAHEVRGGTRLVIVRHAEAWCNLEEFVGGPKSCRGLTPRGVRQAEVLRARLHRTGELAGAAAVYSSDLPRARETADVISDTFTPLSVVERAALAERDAGEADGLAWRELPARYGRSSTPGDAPHEPLAPGGESWVEFLDRAEHALVAVATAHPGELSVVVAHGGIIDASLIRFLGLPEHGAGTRLHAEHTSVTEWAHTGRRWRLVRYNDFAHLCDPDHAPLRSAAPAWVHSETRP